MQLAILWFLELFERLPDSKLEEMLPHVPPSTVRANRKQLVDQGVLCRSQRIGHGKLSRWTWRLARRRVTHNHERTLE